MVGMRYYLYRVSFGPGVVQCSTGSRVRSLSIDSKPSVFTGLFDDETLAFTILNIHGCFRVNLDGAVHG